MNFGHVALIQGGQGAEKDVSYGTSDAMAKALDELGVSYQRVEADRELCLNLTRGNFDRALLGVHGKYAEDGTVQGICEFLKIPYTGSGVLTSALCMDKLLSKRLVAQQGGLVANYVLAQKNILLNTSEIDKLGYPLVVKPVREGSSVGISIVKTHDDLQNALDLAFKYDNNVLVEEFIDGPEVTVPVMAGQTFTPIEIEPKSGFYDYENKYTVGKTLYHMPARLDDKLVSSAREQALKICAELGLRGCARVDFRFNSSGQSYFIEVNTLPGFTETSLVPQAAKHDGLDFSELIREVLTLAQLDYHGLA